jgi:hypothetical protein
MMSICHYYIPRITAWVALVQQKKCSIASFEVINSFTHYDNDTFRKWFAYTSHDLRIASQVLRSQMRNAEPAALRVLTLQ